MIGEVVPPQADDPRLYADFLGNRSGAATSRRQQNNPGSLQITLQCPHRRSATSFQHRAILPRNADFPRFGNHPDLELLFYTFQGKQVLVSGSARAIKTALLDQKFVAGLGNIYACESSLLAPAFILTGLFDLLLLAADDDWWRRSRRSYAPR